MWQGIDALSAFQEQGTVMRHIWEMKIKPGSWRERKELCKNRLLLVRT